MRALALLLAVAVPSSSFAYGPTDDPVEAPRAAPSARLLPQEQPAPAAAVPTLVERPPVYKHWAFWVGLGTITAGAIAAVISAIILGQRTQTIPTGRPQPSCPTCV
jgi:hypothetical protein